MTAQLELLSARDALGPDPIPDLAAADRIIVSSSGGKDSQVALDETVRLADAAGVRDRIVVLHCDLGVTPRGHTIEWPGTLDLARAQAEHYGLSFEVRRSAKWESLLHRIRARGRFPNLFNRYCTAEMKRNVSRKFITEQVAQLGITGRPARVVLCLGLRAAESRNRAAKPPIERDPASSGRRTITLWYPVLRWSTEEVWERIHATGVPYHWAYREGMSRLSCSLCPLASASDLTCAARLRPELAAEYAETERETGSPFRRDLTMAEIIERAGAAV
ncbi:phosphoadenosine phosphosulfate reductase family protein [Streptantibioticus ferralitis]|uniref:Phosphoadenosine phosphosulfate reductase family protein n=1 Tax=Streptantibioticus ferralitis TaxID=236510 RepID=A0ABT5Z043_9ACTN|nr:phosphoadenosine phosphosulfate reductase family protein [Streptantibioticus ferralitis]MDF2257159.1 phosphoadenosine phosphosulfate reductase family protein [Streptantibioticus ferralitis]